jgi:hypothetical protein
LHRSLQHCTLAPRLSALVAVQCSGHDDVPHSRLATLFRSGTRRPPPLQWAVSPSTCLTGCWRCQQAPSTRQATSQIHWRTSPTRRGKWKVRQTTSNLRLRKRDQVSRSAVMAGRMRSCNPWCLKKTGKIAFAGALQYCVQNVKLNWQTLRSSVRSAAPRKH